MNSRVSTTSSSMALMTWTEFERRVVKEGQPVLIPVGAVEQHGWHLPLGTDWIMAEEISRRVSEEVGAVVAPPVCYGYKSQIRSGGGDHWVGTTSLDAATLITLVRDILVSLASKGARRLAVVDGHYENGMILAEACALAVRELRKLGIEDVKIVKLMYGDDLPEHLLTRVYEGLPFPGVALEHAALIETSMMMHCFPQLVGKVDPSQQAANFPPYDVFPLPKAWVPASGSLAPSVGATPEKGRWLVDHFVSFVAGAVTRELVGA